MKPDLVQAAAPRTAAFEGSAREVPVRLPLLGMSAGDAAATPQAQQATRTAAAQQAAREAASEANRKLTEKGSELTIEFDDALRRPIFKLVDTQTRQVVRQIPSEEVIAIARALSGDESSGVILRTDA